MSSMYSFSWYRVANLKPQLRNHVEIHRQPYGNQTTYILQDHSNGKFYRFNEAAYELVGRMNGERTLHEIWEVLLVVMEDSAPTQDEIIGILSRLHKADSLQGRMTPDCLELFRRGEEQRRKKWMQKLRSPMSLKIPLFDPDALLKIITPVLGKLFNPFGFIIWLLVVTLALFAAAPEWSSLKDYAVTNVLEVDNLIILGFIYPFVKVFHEFGHAITTKKWGGEVHEMGISFLVFIPVPYVDASSSSVCRHKYQRMIVSAAGMMVEVFLASLALFLWLSVEDSIVRMIAFNVILIAGVSTLIFNGNPLLKFDAYYILEDLIEVPSLATRSSRYLTYLIQRYLFLLKDAISPVGRAGERFWFVVYGITSTLYRWFITITIIWFVAGKFFVIGIIFALWAVVLQILLPIWKAISFVLLDPRVQQKRFFSITITLVFLTSLFYVFCVVPVPSTTRSEGVLFPPDEALIKATGEGFVNDVLIQPFSNVSIGQSLIELDTPIDRHKLEIVKAELNELSVRYRIAKNTDLLEANLYEESLLAKRAEFRQIQERVKNLVVISPANGRFVPLEFGDLKNQYIRKGDHLGYVVGENAMKVKIAIPQNRIGRIREGYKDVSVILANNINKTYRATVISAVPSAQDKLPSKVLGRAGGGSITVDPNDEQGIKTLESVFHYEVALDTKLTNAPIGLRVYVRFNHGEEPLAMQCYRIVRQLFLGRFGV